MLTKHPLSWPSLTVPKNHAQFPTRVCKGIENGSRKAPRQPAEGMLLVQNIVLNKSIPLVGRRRPFQEPCSMPRTDLQRYRGRFREQRTRKNHLKTSLQVVFVDCFQIHVRSLCRPHSPLSPSSSRICQKGRLVAQTVSGIPCQLRGKMDIVF